MKENVSDLSHVENNFDEKHERMLSGEYFDSDSNNISAFDSEASRINFWKDFNIDLN